MKIKPHRTFSGFLIVAALVQELGWTVTMLWHD